ncbi:MAG TPA: hypothetical protein VIV60_22010 [Polyangiaceae bacterium]
MRNPFPTVGFESGLHYARYFDMSLVDGALSIDAAAKCAIALVIGGLV